MTPTARRPRSASSTPPSGSSTPAASGRSAWTRSSPSPAWPRRPSTSTSRPRTTWCSPTSTGSTGSGPGSCTRPPRPPARDPADQLVGLFDALGTACRREGYRGCAFINAAAEACPGTPVHDRTVAHKQAVLAWVRELADRGRRRRPGPAGPLAHPAAGRRAGGRGARRGPGGGAGRAGHRPDAGDARRVRRVTVGRRGGLLRCGSPGRTRARSAGSRARSAASTDVGLAARRQHRPPRPPAAATKATLKMTS